MAGVHALKGHLVRQEAEMHLAGLLSFTKIPRENSRAASKIITHGDRAFNTAQSALDAQMVLFLQVCTGTMESKSPITHHCDTHTWKILKSHHSLTPPPFLA